MSSVVFAILVGGIVLGGFLLVALLVWTVRSRRAESGLEPASVVEPTAGSPEKSGTLLGDLLRTAVPELSTLVELGKKAQASQAVDGMPQSEEEKKRAFLQAAQEMLTEQPDNTLLRSILASIQNSGMDSLSAGEQSNVQVFRIGGKTTIRAGGTEYADPDEIPDPEDRAKARRMLDALNQRSSP